MPRINHHDLWRYQPTGETFYANDSPPTLPFKVDGIFGLDNSVRPVPMFNPGCVGDLFNPFSGTSLCAGLKGAQLRKAYNAGGLEPAGSSRMSQVSRRVIFGGRGL